jgi:hypothetical protein
MSHKALGTFGPCDLKATGLLFSMRSATMSSWFCVGLPMNECANCDVMNDLLLAGDSTDQHCLCGNA